MGRVLARLLSAAAARLVRAAAGEAPPTSDIVVPLEAVVDEPSRGEQVKLTGALVLVATTTRADDGTIRLRYVIEARDIHGTGCETGAAYEFVGQSRAEVTPLERLVTEADFALIAGDDPGTDIGHVSASPCYRVVLAIQLGADGTIEAVSLASVIADDHCRS